MIVSFIISFSYISCFCMQKDLSLTQDHKDFCLLSRNFFVSTVALRPMINHELIFVHTIGRRSFFFFHVVIQLFQHHLFFKKIAIFPTELPWCICQKSIVLSVQVYIETVYSVPLIYIFILMLKPDYSD